MKQLQNKPPTKKPGPKPKYPYDKWLTPRTKWQQLVREEDYDCKSETIVRKLRYQAKKRGGTISISFDDDFVSFLYPSNVK